MTNHINIKKPLTLSVVDDPRTAQNVDEMQITSDFDLVIGIRRKILSTSFRQKLI